MQLERYVRFILEYLGKPVLAWIRWGWGHLLLCASCCCSARVLLIPCVRSSPSTLLLLLLLPCLLL